MTTIRDLLESGKITPDTVVLGELPMTADKEIVGHGVTIWHPQSIKNAKGMHPGHADLKNFYKDGEVWFALDDHWASVGGVQGYRIDGCYSTRAAAEAARSMA